MVIANKRLTFIIFLLIVVSFIALLIPNNETYADIGPKESVNVAISNLPTSNYITTLIAARGDFFEGPNHYYVISSAPTFYEDDDVKSGIDYRAEIMDKYAENVDKLVTALKSSDVAIYYVSFLNCWESNNTDTIEYTWGYYPPDTFRIVFYDLDNDLLYISKQMNLF